MEEKSFHCENFPTIKVGGYVVGLHNFLLAAIGVVAMAMIVYAGFRYMVSAGNPTAMTDAKDMVYSAVIGLALALLSWLIITTINSELIFTTEPVLAPANVPGATVNVPSSCAYGSIDEIPGPEPPEDCRCIGDTDGPGGRDTDCELKKSEEGFTGSCDALCSAFCVANPRCCVKADLKVGKSLTDITHKFLEVKVDERIYFEVNAIFCESYPSSEVVQYAVFLDPTEWYFPIFPWSTPASYFECTYCARQRREYMHSCGMASW